MKALEVCSYLCCAMSLLAFGTKAFLMIEQMKSWLDIESLGLLIFGLIIVQIIYTWKTARWLSLEKYNASDSLDDFAMNQLDSTDEIVGNGFWLKLFSTLNTALLCFIFFGLLQSSKSLMRDVLSDDNSGGEIYFPIFLLGIFLFAVPTIIYNLRTFNLKRIRKNSISEIL